MACVCFLKSSVAPCETAGMTHYAAVPTHASPECLTPAEEALYHQVQTRLEKHFAQFEVLEGFVVLGTNLQRLLRRVLCEVRSVMRQYHDMAATMDALEHKNAQLRDQQTKQEAMAKELVHETQKLLCEYQAFKKQTQRESKRLEHEYEAKLQSQKATWKLRRHEKEQMKLEAMRLQHQAELQVLEAAHEQQLDEWKRQLEARKQSELEYAESRLRLRLKTQLERDYRQEVTVYERHVEEQSQLIHRLRLQLEKQEKRVG